MPYFYFPLIPCFHILSLLLFCPYLFFYSLCPWRGSSEFTKHRIQIPAGNNTMAEIYSFQHSFSRICYDNILKQATTASISVITHAFLSCENL
jgi:hypothetical protein